MTKLCECGCGQPTPPAKSSGHGYIKGAPLRFIPTHSWRANPKFNEPQPKRPLVERFMEKVEQGDGCWEWRSGCDHGGYGEFRLDGRTCKAHRIAYELFVGAIPDDMQIDHLCRNRGCVNPAHMEVVTPRENYLRGEGVGAINARKTICREGHPLVDGRRGRHCPICARRYQREYKRAQRARRREAMDAAAVYVTFDTLDSQHQIDLSVGS